jgi:hypothetical protein
MRLECARAVILCVALVLIPASQGCSGGDTLESVAGSYKLLSMNDDGERHYVNEADFTLRLMVLPDGEFHLVEIEDGRVQHEWSGDCHVKGGKLILTGPPFEDDVVFAYHASSDLLTLEPDCKPLGMDAGWVFGRED